MTDNKLDVTNPMVVREIVRMVVERAEQACRYAVKHQNFEIDFDADSNQANRYRDGWEDATHLLQDSAIARHVNAHLERDLKELGAKLNDCCFECAEPLYGPVCLPCNPALANALSDQYRVVPKATLAVFVRYWQHARQAVDVRDDRVAWGLNKVNITWRDVRLLAEAAEPQED